MELRPPPGGRREDLKAADCGGAKKVLQLVSRYDDVDVLRHPADIAVTPHGPAAADHGFAITRTNHQIERLNDSAIAAGQVLRFEHPRPPGEQRVGKFQLLR